MDLTSTGVIVRDAWELAVMEMNIEATSVKPHAGWAGLDTKWENRTRLAAEWLQNEKIVADIGCGLMALESFLPEQTIYLPMDVVRRDARTVVVDLNREPIPQFTCDAVVMLGVLEYIDDVEAVFDQLRRFPKTLISYNHISVNDFLWKLGLRKKHVDWRNRNSKTSLRKLLAKAGLVIVRERSIRLGETLYEIHPK